MKRILSGVLAGITVLALTAGCAGQQVGPKLEIAQAVQEFATAGKAGFTITAGGRVEDLIAVAKKLAVADGSTFTAADAGLLRKIYRSSLTFDWDKAGNGAADDKFLAKAVVDGVGAEVRVVGGVTYVRVPIRKLAAKFGASKGEIAAIRQMLGPANPGVDQLFGGGWVWVSAADMTRLTGTLGSVPDQDKFYAQLMISAQNLFDSAAVTVDANDKTHLMVTTSTVKAYREGKRLLQAMKKIADKPAASMLDKTLGTDLRKAPEDRPIVLDLWIENGRLKAFEFNFLQFVKGSTGRASLRIDFSRGRDIAVPRPATKLDPNKILSGIGAPRAKFWAARLGR
jgi:hypothetical protein